MNLLLDLFLTFAKIGLFTFGGGYAMIAMMEHTCVEKKGWITHDEMMTVTVVAESTPGPIAINCATYVGYRKAGVPGAVIATFGMVMPSFAVIYVIAAVLETMLELSLVISAFRGIRIAVGLLILDAALTMLKKMPRKKLPRGIMASACAIMLVASLVSVKISSIHLMVAAGIISAAVFAAGKGKSRKEGQK